jgi:cbb3-type cytochrome oxidase subunit 1
MVGRDWYSRSAASFHFWTTQIGVIVGTVALLAIGAAQSMTGELGTGPLVIEETNVIGLLRVVVAAAFTAVVAAQYVLAYNTFKTSRSGPFVVPAAMQAATIRGSA